MTELPTTFGKYYLIEKLATGGMAEIYLAKLIGPGGFEKPVVIKQIHPKLSGQRHFVDLFVAEAKTLVTLAHGNIVPVYELGVVDETYFIAMDYIDGPTLYRLTETMGRREAPMEPALAAWITARILDGLDYAHRKGEGVIHRDLSPRNVMLSRDGEVKLVDFGIAVTLGEPGEPGARTSAPTGSFPYMSPEQVRRESLTGQTDLFSVGVLFWEMLVGRRLFARGDADATLAAVLGGEIAKPSSERAEVPPRLDDVVMRALERDRAARWASAADMLAALNKYIYSLDEAPGPREVAALVARFCPPETRRLPTHLEAAAHDAPPREPLANGPSGPATLASEPVEPPAASGPRTAVIPRDPPLGKRARRERTFATNVDLASMLEGAATEPANVPASVSASDSASVSDSGSGADSDSDPGSASASASASASSLADPGRERAVARPPSKTLLVVAALGATALAVAAIVVFLKGRDAVLHGFADAAVVTDAARLAAPVDAALAELPDAALAVSAPPDAGVIVSAEPRDAGVRPRDAIARPANEDAAHPRTPPDAGATADRGTATLSIGAAPWGEIYVDGKPMGSTPRELTVSAGRHTIEIVFPVETPPRKQSFAVDLVAGESKALHADFTR
jgi:eukaryotic-like serine/threonine-protein kinase